MPRKPADSLSLLMIHLQNHDSLIGQGKTVFSVAGGDQTLYGHLRNGFADLVFGDLAVSYTHLLFFFVCKSMGNNRNCTTLTGRAKSAGGKNTSVIFL